MAILSRKDYAMKTIIKFLVVLFLLIFPAVSYAAVVNDYTESNNLMNLKNYIVVASSHGLPVSFTEDDMKTLCESKCRQAGIYILDPNKKSTNVLTGDIVAIVAGVYVVRASDDLPVNAISVTLKVSQNLYLPSLKKIGNVIIWDKSITAIAGDDKLSDAIKDEISNLLEKFINDYYKANPKNSSSVPVTMPSTKPVLTLEQQNATNEPLLGLWNKDDKGWWKFLGDLSAVKKAIAAGGDINAIGKDGCSPLIMASNTGPIEVVTFLLDAGANKEAIDPNGNTALMYAAMLGHADIVKLLLNIGANIEAKDKLNETALMKAAFFGKTDIVKLLLDAGANKEAAGTLGPALMCAALRGNVEVVKLLIDSGVNIEAGDKIGDTALLYAARLGKTDIVKLLLDAGAKKETANIIGETALMYAATNGKADVVKLLLDAGANINARDNMGLTILYKARHPYKDVSEADKKNTIAILEAAGAQ